MPLILFICACWYYYLLCTTLFVLLWLFLKLNFGRIIVIIFLNIEWNDNKFAIYQNVFIHFSRRTQVFFAMICTIYFTSIRKTKRRSLGIFHALFSNYLYYPFRVIRNRICTHIYLYKYIYWEGTKHKIILSLVWYTNSLFLRYSIIFSMLICSTFGNHTMCKTLPIFFIKKKNNLCVYFRRLRKHIMRALPRLLQHPSVWKGYVR
jgi:hypothetical protein